MDVRHIPPRCQCFADHLLDFFPLFPQLGHLPGMLPFLHPIIVSIAASSRSRFSFSSFFVSRRTNLSSMFMPFAPSFFIVVVAFGRRDHFHAFFFCFPQHFLYLPCGSQWFPIHHALRRHLFQAVIGKCKHSINGCCYVPYSPSASCLSSSVGFSAQQRHSTL